MTPELQEEIARAIAKAERYAYFPGDEHYDGIALAIAPIIARLVAEGRVGIIEGERRATAAIVAIIETHRDGASAWHRDAVNNPDGHGYCCLKTAANILGAVRGDRLSSNP